MSEQDYKKNLNEERNNQDSQRERKRSNKVWSVRHIAEKRDSLQKVQARKNIREIQENPSWAERNWPGNKKSSKVNVSKTAGISDNDENDDEEDESDESPESNYKANLKKERNKDKKMSQAQFAKDAGKYAAKKLLRSAGNVEVAAARVIWDLFKQIHWSIDWMIFFPLFFAVLKDVLDYIGFSLPVLNESLNFSIGALTAMVLAVLGSNLKSKGIGRKSVRKFIVLLIGMACEEFFGLNLLPIESVTVLVCFLLVLFERVLDAEQEKKATKTQGQEAYAQ